MDKDIPQGLIDRYLDGTASREERLLLETSINRHLGREVELPSIAALDEARPRNRAAALAAIGAMPTGRVRPLAVYASAAAAMLLMAVATAWLFWGERSVSTPADIAPGGNRATLTLADGRVIDLSGEQEGIVIREGITYLDGTEVYNAEDQRRETGVSAPGTEEGSPETTYHILRTPKGGTYQVTLPDGSKVWLNAASTLKYPSRFTGDSRDVFLDGEAFFAVSNRPSAVGDRSSAAGNGPAAGRLPFRVVAKGQTVEVLGTEFNVSAYGDDAETRTTLLQGRVRVEAHGVSLQLMPGEQGLSDDETLTKRQVDTEPYTAWRDGYFKFHGVPITEIMQQLARWYDVDVRYDGPVKQVLYSGRIARSENISAVLRIMELTDAVQFDIDANERRVIVKH